MKSYTDIDYDSFSPADLNADIHWIQLPTATLLADRQALAAALQQERIAAQPADHQIILISSDPTYSPGESELWPIINHTVQQTLKSHEAAYADVMSAVHQAIDTDRG